MKRALELTSPLIAECYNSRYIGDSSRCSVRFESVAVREWRKPLPPRMPCEDIQLDKVLLWRR